MLWSTGCDQTVMCTGGVIPARHLESPQNVTQAESMCLGVQL